MTTLNIPFFNLSRQYESLREEILEATDQVYRSGQVMDGPHTAAFETWLAKKNNVKYAITCHSGTQALEIICAYYAEHKGTKTFYVPSFTYIATANAAIKYGKVLLLDAGVLSGCVAQPSIPFYSAGTTVIGVGMFGEPLDIKYPSLIEDGAQHWLANGCKRVSDTAISFDPTKNLASFNNGGAVVTNDELLADFALSMRSNNTRGFGITNITPTSAGTNSKMSELDCAIMMIKTKYIDSWQARRLEIANYWREMLYGNRSNFEDHALNKFVVNTGSNVTRNKLALLLAERSIETKIHYAKPLHLLEQFKQCRTPCETYHGSDFLSRTIISLPFYPELTDEEVEYVGDSVIF
jgi:dTDP-4-amino-4,6-dideoxygalactose transaminase